MLHNPYRIPTGNPYEAHLSFSATTVNQYATDFLCIYCKIYAKVIPIHIGVDGASDLS